MSTEFTDGSAAAGAETVVGKQEDVSKISGNENGVENTTLGLSEEKKQAAPGENDGGPNVDHHHKNQDPSLVAINPGVLSPTSHDLPKQTARRDMAMPVAKIPPKPEDNPLSPVAGTSNPSGTAAASASSNSHHHHHHHYSSSRNDDEDSSNDDSSYFADPSNLPSPGEAGRKYSFGSHASAARNNAARESDASLSLSDDSDDGNNNNALGGGGGHHRGSGGNPHRQQAAAPEVFPQQRITRMHSVGSLVSTSSQNSDENQAVGEEFGGGNDSGYDGVRGGGADPHGGPMMLYSGGSPLPLGPVPPPPHMMGPDYRPYPLPPAGYSPYGYQQTSMGQLQQQHLLPQQNQYALSKGAGGYGGGPGPGGIPPLQYGRNSGAGISGMDGNAKIPAKGQGGIPPFSDPTQKATDSGGRQEYNMPVSGGEDEHDDEERHFKVYWQRWIMLMYMSILNLLSDWTCYSVAPIAVLTQEAFGDVDPEQLVTIFLAANAIASACEPIILSRLGLRRTVLFGSLLLMVGSMVKSGGMPPIIDAKLEKGHCEVQLYIGFFLVGLSQPLYQCTPALLSASWFPERERTMATGVALNANQLGIGCAFVFGTLLVATNDDIPGYFGLLSIISTIAFFGTLFQFDDAPPTPPSDSARVMRGTLEVNLPSVQTILQSIGVGQSTEIRRDIDEAINTGKPAKSSSKRSSAGKPRRSGKTSSSHKSRGGNPPVAERSSRRKSKASSQRSRPHERSREPHAPAPSAAFYGGVYDIVTAPSPMMPGNVGGEDGETERQNNNHVPPPSGFPYGGYVPPPMGYPAPAGFGAPTQGMAYGYPSQSYLPQGFAPQGYSGYGYPDPRFSQQYQYPSQGYFQPVPQVPYSYQHAPPRPDMQMYRDPYSVLPPAEGVDDGAEPVLTITPHHLDIDIRDDQIILAIRACFARPGFIHSLVTFTVSGIVINTLSTYMDYLVRLNGAGREYTGIVGGSFQGVIMISSLIMGGLTDKSRAYYSVTVGMLVVGAFGLAECGVSLNADRGSDLRFALIAVAALVGPLQPVSTELGVEVVYPLSENTVLVIQQLFSNLLSALFIPLFKELKDIGASAENGTPQYTFSFYLLIVLHAAATVFVATFNGRYLRYEHEQRKKDEKEKAKERKRQEAFENGSVASIGSFQHPLTSGAGGYIIGGAERQPLVNDHMNRQVV